MPILPIGMSQLFEGIDYCFILPQFWANEKYKSIYTSRPWDTVIIDNAMYEDPENRWEIPRLIEVADELDARRIFLVGNENMYNGVKSIELICNEIDECGQDGANWTYMGVLHGTPGEIAHQYAELRRYARIGFAVAVSTFRLGYDRSIIVERLGLSSNGRYIHALGLDSMREAKALEGYFNSCDSSICASAAENNVDLTIFPEIRRDLQCCKYMKRVDLLQESFSREKIEQTEFNLNYIRGILEEG